MAFLLCSSLLDGHSQDDSGEHDPDNLRFNLVATITNAHGEADVNCVSWSPVGDGHTLASAGDDQVIRLWRYNASGAAANGHA